MLTEEEVERIALEYLRRHNPACKDTVFINEVEDCGEFFLARGYWSEDNDHLFRVKIDKEGKVHGMNYPPNHIANK